MRSEDDIKKEIEKLNKEIDKNSSPFYGLALVERKNTLLWVLDELWKK